MAARTSYAKQVYALSTTWVPIIAPIPCNYFALRNTGSVDCHMKTDETAAGGVGYDILPAGSQEGIVAPYNKGGARFNTGETVLWAKAASGTVTLAVTWVF